MTTIGAFAFLLAIGGVAGMAGGAVYGLIMARALKFAVEKHVDRLLSLDGDNDLAELSGELKQIAEGGWPESVADAHRLPPSVHLMMWAEGWLLTLTDVRKDD